MIKRGVFYKDCVKKKGNLIVKNILMFIQAISFCFSSYSY
jgi:hypothetical protein